VCGASLVPLSSPNATKLGRTLDNCHQAKLSVPMPRLGLMAGNSLSVPDREFFLAEPHVRE
jgi:hypothetical protein